MSKDLQKIDNLFKRAIEPYEETPSERVWERIESKLELQDIVRRRKKFYLLRLTAVCIVLLMLGIGLYKLPGIRKKSGGKEFAKNHLSPSESIYDSPTLKNEIHNIKGGLLPDDTFKKHGIFKTKKIRKNNFSSSAIYPAYSLHGSRPIQGTQPLPSSRIVSVSPSKSPVISDYNRFFNTVHKLPFISNPLASLSGHPLGSLIKYFKIDSAKYIPLPSILSTVGETPSYSHQFMVGEMMKKRKTYPDRFLRLSVSVIFSPDVLTNYRMQNHESSGNQNESDKTGAEKSGFSYNSGVLIDYAVDKNWKLESGITITNSKLLIKPSTIYAEQDDNTGEIDYSLHTFNGISKIPNTFSAPPQLHDSLKLTSNSAQQVLYASFPLIIKYRLEKDRIVFNFFSGLGINLLLNESTDLTIQKGNSQVNETVNNIEGLKNYYLNYILGTEIQFHIAKKLTINFRPALLYGITSLNQNIPIRTTPYSFGLGSGFTWNF